MTFPRFWQPEQRSTDLRAIRLLVLFISLCALISFWSAIKALAMLAIQDDRYVQIIGGPLICLFLIHSDQAEIFSNARYSPGIGIPFFSFALLSLMLAGWWSPRGDIVGMVPLVI